MPDSPSHIDSSTARFALPQRLLLGVSGSVAVLGLPVYIQALRAGGIEQIATVLTPTAQRFLPADTLRLLCDAVYTESDHGPGHVGLGRWADQILLLPATAHMLGCIAHGLAPNLLATILIAATRPAVLAPAMNPVMWRQPAVRRTIAQLRDDGHTVIDPVPGLAYEVASRRICPSLVIPPPDHILGVLHQQISDARSSGNTEGVPASEVGT